LKTRRKSQSFDGTSIAKKKTQNGERKGGEGAAGGGEGLGKGKGLDG